MNIIYENQKHYNVVKYALPKDNETILASQYQLYLPSEKELLDKLGFIMIKISKSERR